MLQSSEETFDLDTTSDLSVMTNQPLPERKKVSQVDVNMSGNCPENNTGPEHPDDL